MSEWQGEDAVMVGDPEGTIREALREHAGDGDGIDREILERAVARIKAEALREALQGFALSPHVSYPGVSVHEELERRAASIEREAGL